MLEVILEIKTTFPSGTKIFMIKRTISEKSVCTNLNLLQPPPELKFNSSYTAGSNSSKIKLHWQL